VYNKGIDSGTNAVPSTFVIPSSHPDLVAGEQNNITEGDFLFVLRDTTGSSANNGRYGDNYETRYSRIGKTETPVVTIQKANELLRDYASKQHKNGNIETVELWKQVEGGNHESFWWMCPQSVANWTVPFGVALNSMRVNHSNGRQSGHGHNVVVSRRASVKNNFFTVRGDAAETWHTQSMRHVAIQYNVEAVILQDGASEAIPVVQLSMLLVDDPARVRGTPYDTHEWYVKCDAGNRGVCRSSRLEIYTNCENDHLAQEIKDVAPCLVINSVHADNPRPNEASFSLFANRPLGNPATRVIVPIGRILHSAPRCPTASDCLNSCHSKSIYNRMAPVEVELGCH
jgi:hypothetical protein